MDSFTVISLIFWITILFLALYHFFYWFVYVLQQRSKIKAGGELAKAHIIDYNISTDLDGVKFYTPVLEFTTSSGQRIVVEADSGSTSKYPAGKQLDIYYCIENPYQFYIKKSIPFQVFLLPFGSIVVAMAIYAIVHILSNYKN